MKRVIYSLFVFGIILVGLTGCDTKNDGIKFKNDYEKLNGVTNSSGNEHRTVSIEEDNSFVYSTTEEIIAKINNNDTFYVYFGSPYCPWCRSVIEKAISVANSKGIDKIYYIDIWDDNYTELLRDTYKINDENEAELVKEGSDDYKELFLVVLFRIAEILIQITLVTKIFHHIGVIRNKCGQLRHVFVLTDLSVSHFLKSAFPACRKRRV